MNKTALYFRTVLLLLVWNILPTATPRAGFTRCGARTRDHRREATLLLLLLQSGATVAVVWAHARTQELCLWPMGGGYTPLAGCAASRPWHLSININTVSQWQESRLWETQLATYYYSGDSPRHQQGVGPPSTASVVWVSELQTRYPMYLARATSRRVCFMSRQAGRS